MTALKEKDPKEFRNYMRMTVEVFDSVLATVRPRLVKCKKYRATVSPEERLAVTLRFLATGDQIRSIARNYRIGASTCAKCIYETLDVIWEELGPIYMAAPTEDDWRESEGHFHVQWNLPNCVGAVDGKHVNIVCPNNTGSTYYNYKGGFSTVLMAVVDGQYRFKWISVGSAGKEADSTIFRASDLGQRLESGQANMPGPKPLPGTGIVVPHVICGDEAFPLRTFLMRPFPGTQLHTDNRRVFNYRLSRARRVVENAFGILAQRSRCFMKPLYMEPSNAIRVVRAACVLHNMLCKRTSRPTAPEDIEDLPDNGTFQPLHGCISSNNYPASAAHLREVFTEYFHGEGSVYWQNTSAGLNE